MEVEKGDIQASGASGSNVSAVSVTARIPDFWKDAPRVWFIQTEAVLQPQHLGDEAKYQLVIAKLGKEVIHQVTDILIEPPSSNKYNTLKRRLLDIYEEFEVRKIQKLIGEMDLGEQKPSQLLRRMQELAGSKIAKETLAILWQNHLPTSVRSVLTVTDSKELDTLATIADKVMESLLPAHTVAAVEQIPGGAATNIISEIQKLSNRIKHLEMRRPRSRSRCNHRGRGRSRTRSRAGRSGRSPADPDWLCFYHFRYKNKASKCVAPCNWKNVNTNAEN